ncbi:long-chain-fatty-acid--CoA ligase [Pelotomaculum propionicicum]|uniref:long-chain-fatty-acid--CoA ligase n=1 Tax=Pelotomaculum propionicicum TaxID=258475 RepID=UPI003B7B426C
MLVHELIQTGSGDKIAIYEKGAAYSYAQLQRKVSQYRSYLYALGVRGHDNVALYARNSAEFIFSYMAIASLGGVVVPLNTMLTPREIAFILKDAEVKHVITDKDINFSGQFEEGSGPPIKVFIADIEKETADKRYPDPSAVLIKESDPCVILYTSGTTGRPKGALLSHNNLVSNARAFSEATESGPDDNTLCVLPMFHSFGWTCTIATPLYNGASITIVETFLPKDVIATIRDHGITLVAGVPAMYNFYTSLAKPEDLAGVRLFVSGGASLPMEILERFHEKTKKHVIEGYGLSEASPVVAFNPLSLTKPGSIGLPVLDNKVKIFDNNGNEMGCREIGELLVQGPNVMLGYYNLPAETAEALRDGWLYTGDLAYIDEDGYIFIVDRKKDMIIVSGLNVYPREVEEILYQYPAIKEAAAIGVPDKSRGESVRAYVVLKEDMKLDKKDLMAFLKSNLAQFKLPREIVEIDSLPKNATGKILKKELRNITS